VTDAPDPGLTPGYILPPPLSDTALMTVGDARKLHESMDALDRTVGTFNDRLAGGERRWAVLTALSLAIVLVLGGVIWLGYGVRGIARCQAAQSDAIISASAASRTTRDAADDQQVIQLGQFRGQIQQQIALLTASLNPDSTVQDRITATRGYLDQLQQSDQTALKSQQTIITAKKTRADNPLPTGKCT
jgi:hypothetical protein